MVKLNLLFLKIKYKTNYQIYSGKRSIRVKKNTFLKRDEGDELHNQILQSINIGHPVFTKELNPYLETYYEYNLNDHSINNYFDAALQYGVSKVMMVDLGIQKAANHALFVGIAIRI